MKCVTPTALVVGWGNDGVRFIMLDMKVACKVAVGNKDTVNSINEYTHKKSSPLTTMAMTMEEVGLGTAVYCRPVNSVQSVG